MNVYGSGSYVVIKLVVGGAVERWSVTGDW